MLWIWNPVPTWTISPGLTHQRVSTPAVLQSKSSAPPMWHHGIHLVHVKSKKILICALHPICDRYIYFVGHLGDFQHLICGALALIFPHLQSWLLRKTFMTWLLRSLPWLNILMLRLLIGHQFVHVACCIIAWGLWSADRLHVVKSWLMPGRKLQHFEKKRGENHCFQSWHYLEPSPKISLLSWPRVRFHVGDFEIP